MAPEKSGRRGSWFDGGMSGTQAGVCALRLASARSFLGPPNSLGGLISAGSVKDAQNVRVHEIPIKFLTAAELVVNWR